MKYVNKFWDEIEIESAIWIFLQISIYFDVSREIDFLSESTGSVTLIFHEIESAIWIFLQISIYFDVSREIDFLSESTGSVTLIFHHNLLLRKSP